MTQVAKGSSVQLLFSDGTRLEWRAGEDLTLDRALDTIERLRSLDPGGESR